MPDPNRALFESVVRLLGPVLDDLVFVGGCTTGLFVTDSVAGGIRSTKDVDASVLGFSNRWYSAAIETAQFWRIAGQDVRIVTLASRTSTFWQTPACRDTAHHASRDADRF